MIKNGQELIDLIRDVAQGQALPFDQVRTGVVAPSYSGSGVAPVQWDGESSPTTNGYPFIENRCPQAGDRIVGFRISKGKNERYVIAPYGTTCVATGEGTPGPVSQSGLILVQGLSSAGILELAVNPAHTLQLLGDNFTFSQPSSGIFRVGLEGLAPTDAPYITTTPVTGLSNEKVLGDSILMVGLAASRPAAGVAGRQYYATDTDVLYRDTGSAWIATELDWAQITGKPSTFAPSAHQSSHQSGGSDALTGLLDANARITVRKNAGSDVGPRRRLNLIEGSNVTLTVADDSADEEIDVTIASSGGAGYTDEQAQDAVGGILVDTATVDFTYDDATPQITADVKDGSITVGKLSTTAKTLTLNVVIDGGGAAITTGTKLYGVKLSFDATLIDWEITADVSGSIVIDIKKRAFGGGAAASLIDTGSGGVKPTLSSASESQSSSLANWTTSISAGDKLYFIVDSATTVGNVTLAITLRRA